MYSSRDFDRASYGSTALKLTDIEIVFQLVLAAIERGDHCACLLQVRLPHQNSNPAYCRGEK